MHLLELVDVSAYYDAVAALQDCSIYIDEGELVSIVGSNGAGKTTICKTISGIIPAKSGKILFKGTDITIMPSYERVDLGIVQCPEGRHIFPIMTVLENLQMGAFPKAARADVKKNLDYVLDLFPILEKRKNQAARTLSGGEQQMLAIGRAMMSNPKLLIMDEPSLGLSPINVQLIFEKMKEIRDGGITILLIEQNVEKSLNASKRGYVLENGRIVMEGSGTELLNDDRLKKAYLGL